jgi:hypothetical protein
VKVTQNWSLEAKLMFAESTNRWPILEIGARFCVLLFFRNVFFGPDLVQFYGSYFYYKYRHCISVNLEIEGAETRV